MSSVLDSGRFLVSVEAAAALDTEARTEWGFNVFALIEAAGRSCARLFTEAFPDFFNHRYLNRSRVAVAIGAGSNGADAMVMLRYWILAGLVDPSLSVLVAARLPKNGENAPWVELLGSLKKMNVPVLVWNGDTAGAADDALARSDIIVDGIAGTGLKGALRGPALEMVNAINLHTHPFVVSVDLPSGNSDEWKPGMPIVEADATLAIEPRKLCLYTPAARPYGGTILPVKGIFPGEIISRHGEAEILDWESVQKRIRKIPPSAYKNQRGTVEIWAGSTGTTGAALVAARGAQAAGAGLVRLVADEEIYPIVASQAAGIITAPAGSGRLTGRASLPDAILLGPGWGKTHDRGQILKDALSLEQEGVPLVLDADAIELVKDKVFNGNVILTPHPGEFCKFSGIDKEELLFRPIPILLQYARERRGVILFKGHVITIAAPDGRIGIVDGMTPGLATGGSGDLLAGLCAAIAARMAREGPEFDAYTCAAAAAALLIAAGRTEELKRRFTDPMELAGKAADLAGTAWLSPDTHDGIKGYFYGR